MILERLYEYYTQRLNGRYGFSHESIPYLIIIDRSGKFVRFEDTYTDEARKKARSFFVPSEVIPSSNLHANIAYGKPGYLFGLSDKNDNRLEQKKKTFVAKVKMVSDLNSDNSDLAAVLRFYDDSSNFDRIKSDALWSEILLANRNIAFKLEESRDIVASGIDVLPEDDSDRVKDGICIITGNRGKVAKLHNAVRGMHELAYGGVPLVSHNCDAVTHFDAEQGYCAPIDVNVMHGYVEALKDLLKRAVKVRNTYVVFWCNGRSVVDEDDILSLVGDDSEGTARLNTFRNRLLSPVTGVQPAGEDSNFFVLGLEPNQSKTAGRIVIRFWHDGSAAELTGNIKQYFNDIDIVSANGEGVLSLKELLSANSKRLDDLIGDVFMATLNNRSLPRSVLQRAVNGVQKERLGVDHADAALIKLCLNRMIRNGLANNMQEVKVELNVESNSIGYNLGRLFAVLEQVQRKAMPDINKTIVDNYFASASIRPGVVFPGLLKSSKHYASKIDPGLFQFFENLKSEIMEHIKLFPAILTLEEQGMFMIGYYQQRKFKASEGKEEVNYEKASV